MSDASDRLTEALEGRYRIERETGVGGMAVVYLARDLKHKCDVALRELREGEIFPDAIASALPAEFRVAGAVCRSLRCRTWMSMPCRRASRAGARRAVTRTPDHMYGARQDRRLQRPGADSTLGTWLNTLARGLQ